MRLRLELLGKVLLMLVLMVGCRARRFVTPETQLNAMTNLVEFCAPISSVSAMHSTFDRRGGNVDWWDIPKPVPCSTDLYEALRVDGPGCVKRIWTTNVPATEWLFYFDNEATPRIELKPEDFFSDDRREFPMRGWGISGGSFSYLPLPFAKSLRVVMRMKDIQVHARPYFQINYELYPSGTRVTSWPRSPSAELSNTMARVKTTWRGVAAESEAAAERLAWQSIALPAQQAREILAVKGRGTITTLGIKPELKGLNALMRSLLLRSLVLEAYWDGASQPSVQVPLGDFFCNGLHPREFASLPLANIDGAYICRLPMPFRRGARLVIRNDSPVALSLGKAFEIDTDDPGPNLYLHASFNATISSGAPFRIMRTTGAGKYVGCYLIALGMDGGWNILEGDEKFYRDGELKPAQHGTGLEDYFNGGWYYFGLCELPLHGLLEKAVMRTAQYRFHLNDPVTFRKDLRMEIEFGDANSANGYMSAAAFWYQDKPGPADSTIASLDKRFPPLDRVGWATIMCELFELERMGLIGNAMERCEFYTSVLAGNPENGIFRLRALAYREMLDGHVAVREAYAAIAASTNFTTEVVSQAKLLLWRGEKPGRAIFGAHAYADYRLFVDGQLLGTGNSPWAWQAWPVELTPGEHLLEAEVTPNQPQAFFSAGFSSFFTNIVSDFSWDYLAVSGVGTNAIWRPYDNIPGYFPTMAWWQFMPNAFVCVQSGQQQGGPYENWTKPLNKTVRLRRRIVVPEVCGDRPPRSARLYHMPSLAVRPKDDTSNQGLSHH